MKKTLATVGILILVVAFAIPALAHGPGWKKGRGLGMGISERGAHHCELIPNLTSEQSAKLADLKAERMKEVLPLRNELIANRAELRALWAQTAPDKNTIFAKQKEINELELKLREKMTHYRFERRNVLTPEQQAQLKSEQPRKGFGYRTKRPGAQGYGRMMNW